MKSFLSITALFLLVCSTSVVHAADLKKDLKGTWQYEAPQAPSEYQKGQIVFYDEEATSQVKILANGQTIKAKNLKVENDQVTFDFYVDYEYCKAVLKYNEEQLSGKVQTSQGDIPVTMKRKKAEKK